MQYAIEIKNLCKQYPKFALQSVSFTLPMGYIMGFIGENGAGKTTVMKSMLPMCRLGFLTGVFRAPVCPLKPLI